MKKPEKTNMPTAPPKIPALRKLSDGVYTIVGYAPPKLTSPAEVRKIVKTLLAPVRAPVKD